MDNFAAMLNPASAGTMVKAPPGDRTLLDDKFDIGHSRYNLRNSITSSLGNVSRMAKSLVPVLEDSWGVGDLGDD
jgi:hypothetical protein